MKPQYEKSVSREYEKRKESPKELSKKEVRDERKKKGR
jgi:hypothetical protein